MVLMSKAGRGEEKVGMALMAPDQEETKTGRDGPKPTKIKMKR